MKYPKCVTIAGQGAETQGNTKGVEGLDVTSDEPPTLVGDWPHGRSEHADLQRR
jgi:hypothetical protein